MVGCGDSRVCGVTCDLSGCRSGPDVHLQSAKRERGADVDV